MHPILWQWRGVVVYSYPAMLYMGLVCGALAGHAAAHAAGLDAERTSAATLVLIIPALAGARLLFVITHWQHYRNAPRRIWARGQGGAAMYGGLPPALCVSVPLLKALDLPFAAFWDTTVFTILTGMIWARLGCLLNGCCGGRPSDRWFALSLPSASGICERRVPTQLLEMGWAAALLAGALLLWPVRPFPGALFLALLGGYSAGRCALESTRENVDGVASMQLNWAISFALVCTALTGFAIAWP